jgi:hypothetical protein
MATGESPRPPIRLEESWGSVGTSFDEPPDDHS